jgi:hypothetical protein
MSGLLFSVDNITIGKDLITGLLGDAVVVEFSSILPWYAVNREYVTPITAEEMIRRNAADGDEIDKLHSELKPKKEKNGDRTGQYL